MGGDSKEDPEEAAARLKMPVEFLLEADDYTESDETGSVYHDNWTAAKIFKDMRRQWIVGGSGIVGLNYETLPVFIGIRKVPESEHEDLLDCLQVMEEAALDHFKQEG